MEQIDSREKTFRYELGDGAYITGKGGTVTIVANGDIVLRCNNLNVQAGGNVNISAGGAINMTAPEINLN